MKTINSIKRITTAVLLAGTIMMHHSCTSSFDELNTNPDASTQVTPAMLATKVILDHVQSGYNASCEFMVKRMFWGEQMDAYQYNRFGKGSFGSLQALTNAMKMVELSPEADKDAYNGLFYYLKAWAFYRTTLDMGDIPYSQALQPYKYRYPA